MCGIAGIVGKEAYKSSSIVHKMVASLRHRGPDGNGIKPLGRSAIFGHSRLAIVDLQNGKQPMQTPDGAFCVTFNGEIYGYQSIRKRIEYNFITDSDTELLLALYKINGKGMLDELPGMFSFAIWDSASESLFCARDRFGEKPFFYAFSAGGCLVFASEIKALLASGLIRPKLSMVALAHFLRMGYVHPSQTIYKNIFTLPPASWLSFSDGKLVVRRYWHPPQINSKISLEDASTHIETLLEKAVQKQMVADVPISGFLSGGIDSTTIMALASKHASSLSAFSFDFGEADSESDIAEISAQKYGLEFLRIQVREESPLDILKKTVSIYDEPFADSSAIPTYLISQAAAKHTKVALTGDGGDELFGGYGCYLPLLDFERKRRALKFDKQIYFAAKVFWKIHLRSEARRLFSWRDEILQVSGLETCWQALAESRSFFTGAEVSRLLKGSVYEQDQPSLALKKAASLEDAFLYDIETWMAGDILVKTDRASMAHGLELRAPFLDVDLAEFAMTLPAKLKISHDKTKIVFRCAFESIWVDEVSQARKRGFESPIGKWLARVDFQEEILKLLLNPDANIYTVLDYEYTIKAMNKGHLQLYLLLVFAIWFEKNGVCV